LTKLTTSLSYFILKAATSKKFSFKISFQVFIQTRILNKLPECPDQGVLRAKIVKVPTSSQVLEGQIQAECGDFIQKILRE
jgi:hypothetical protein